MADGDIRCGIIGRRTHGEFFVKSRSAFPSSAGQVLEELLALGLVYWRAPDNLDFTPVGEKVFKELDAE